MIIISLKREIFLFQDKRVNPRVTNSPVKMTGRSQVFFFRIPKKRIRTPRTESEMMTDISDSS
jgi:hypothetical protein